MLGNLANRAISANMALWRILVKYLEISKNHVSLFSFPESNIFTT